MASRLPRAVVAASLTASAAQESIHVPDARHDGCRPGSLDGPSGGGPAARAPPWVTPPRPNSND